MVVWNSPDFSIMDLEGLIKIIARFIMYQFLDKYNPILQLTRFSLTTKTIKQPRKSISSSK